MGIKETHAHFGEPNSRWNEQCYSRQMLMRNYWAILKKRLGYLFYYPGNYVLEMSTREYVAREAARLLYNRTVKEYKDAKEIAASSLGSRVLPSNYDIAVELDKLVEEREGSDRLCMLIEMRRIALEVMRRLEECDPVLIGSVWRGTPRKGSDIDIVIYDDDWRSAVGKLREYTLISTELLEFIVNGIPRRAVHINLNITDYPVEVIIRPPEDREHYKDEQCETYGGPKRGLRLLELEKLIQIDPLRRFVPKRRIR